MLVKYLFVIVLVKHVVFMIDFLFLNKITNVLFINGFFKFRFKYTI